MSASSSAMVLIERRYSLREHESRGRTRRSLRPCLFPGIHFPGNHFPNFPVFVCH